MLFKYRDFFVTAVVFVSVHACLAMTDRSSADARMRRFIDRAENFWRMPQATEADRVYVLRVACLYHNVLRSMPHVRLGGVLDESSTRALHEERQTLLAVVRVLTARLVAPDVEDRDAHYWFHLLVHDGWIKDDSDLRQTALCARTLLVSLEGVSPDFLESLKKVCSYLDRAAALWTLRAEVIHELERVVKALVIDDADVVRLVSDVGADVGKGLPEYTRVGGTKLAVFDMLKMIEVAWAAKTTELPYISGVRDILQLARLRALALLSDAGQKRAMLSALDFAQPDIKTARICCDERILQSIRDAIKEDSDVLSSALECEKPHNNGVAV